MPRNLTANAIAEIAKKKGTGPNTIIGIDWLGNGNEILYADRDYPGVHGAIIQLTPIDEIIKIGTNSSSSTVEVVLDGIEQPLKQYFNNVDLHKKPCTVYQYFDGMALTDKFVLFRGEINTPVAWSETNQTLRLNILSKVESKEVGFAPEEGQFQDVLPAHTGKVWPLCFGSVAHIPATRTSDVLRGNITTTIGIPDATLPLKQKQLQYNYNYYIRTLSYYNHLIYYAYSIARPPINIASDYLATISQEDGLKQSIEDYSTIYESYRTLVDELYELLEEAPTPEDALAVQDRINELLPILSQSKAELDIMTANLATVEGIKEYFEIEAANAEYEFEIIGKLKETIAKIVGYLAETVFELNKIGLAIAQQKSLHQTQFTVVNGNKFPQGQKISLICKGMKLIGSFSGDVFTLTKIEPRYKNVKIAARQTTDSFVDPASKKAFSEVETATDDLENLNAFWIKDATIDLAGNYCLLSNGRIIKVTDQIGTKCFFQLEEIESDLERSKPYEPAEELDLTSWLWNQINRAGCQEFTRKERQEKIRSVLGEDQTQILTEVEDRLKSLIELIDEAPTDDDRRAVQNAIYRDLGAFQSIIMSLRFPVKDVLEAHRLINDEEFRTFLSLENLHRKELWRSRQTTVINVPGYYSLTGPQITGSIVEAAPVILPKWLPFLSNQDLSDLDDIATKLPNGQSIITGKIPKSTLWVAEGGNQVLLDSSYQEKFVCNVLPSTIKSVYAYRDVDGFKRLVPVPSSYYTKNESDDYGDYECTTITLYRPLSEYDDERWDSELFVSLTSSVGPNTVDIIRWIVENYTDLTVDTTTFNAVKTKINNYPSHFALFDKKDALKLIEEIAWQARCMIWVKFKTVYIRYLADTPSSVDTLTETDIQTESIDVSYTPTEEVVTKFVAEWKVDYSQQKSNQVIVRYNIPKYGEVERKYDFYIYNIESLVRKSATFWSIRYANVWKRLSFKTFLTKLKLETLDHIILDLQDNLITTDPTLALIEKLTYDTDALTITLDCWLPVRAGEMFEYSFAHPAGLDVDTIYPTVDDVAAGIAGGNSRVPYGNNFSYNPANPIDGIDIRPKDFGSIFPSDAYDTMPVDPLLGYFEVDFQINRPVEYELPEKQTVADNEPFRTQPTKQTIIKDTVPFYARIESHIHDASYTLSKSDGFTITARELNYNSERIARVGKRVLVVWNAVTGRYEFNNSGSESQSGKLIKATVVSLYDNYINCNLNGSTIRVLLPYSLRKSTFHGQTISSRVYNWTGIGLRTIAYSVYTEYQRISIEYTAGDVLYIMQIEPELIDSYSYKYLDANVDARSWGTYNGV